MSDRRRLDEVIVRYELEPELRDIFVEGARDSRLIKWFLREKGIEDCAIYEVSTVEIPTDILSKYNLDEHHNNNRGRVVALALELESALGEQAQQATCIIDSDFDLLLSEEERFADLLSICAEECADIFFVLSLSCSTLLKTDYTSLEIYFWEERYIEKLLCFCFPDMDLLGDSPLFVADQLASILQDLFLSRLSNELMKRKYRHVGFELEYLSFQRCCEVTESREIVFDLDDYVTRYLSKSDWLDKKDEFMQIINFWRGRLLDDNRCQMHGHDYFALLAWYISELNGNSETYTSKVVEICMFMRVEAELLEHEPFFLELLQRIGGA